VQVEVDVLCRIDPGDICRALIETNPDPVAIVQDGRFEYVNPSFSELLGFSQQELRGLTFLDLVADASGPWSGCPSGEVLLLARDGTSYLCEISVRRIRYEGRPAELIVTREITARRQVEQALLASEARLRQVIDLVPHFIFAKDRNGRYILVNNAVAEAYGTTVKELIGKTDADFNPLREEVEHFVKDDLEVIASGKPKDIPEEVLTDWQGRPRYVHTTKIPFTLSGTGEDAVLGVSTDISERKHAEQEQRRLEQQLQQAQKLESLGILAGGIAHDFNNLLVGILGNAELVQMDMEQGSAMRCRVDEIVMVAHQASLLTNQMLAYSGKGQFLVEAVDLSEQVREILTLVKGSLPKRATFELDLARDLPGIEVDVAQLHQVVINLVLNSSEAMGDGGVVSISTGQRECSREMLDTTALGQTLEPGTFVFLEVSDAGCGIAEEQMQKIFDPFFTTKFTGRGLGLSAVLGIIRGHGGTLRVTSEPGRGTSFRVFFPATFRPVAPREPDREPAPRAGGGLILVVDDEAVVRDVARHALGRFGYETLMAHHGQKAVEICREQGERISLVLLDLSMPGMDGVETLAELQRIRPDLPVVLCSGYNEKEAMDRFHGKGLSGFLQKPFRVKELVETVERAMTTERSLRPG